MRRRGSARNSSTQPTAKLRLSRLFERFIRGQAEADRDGDDPGHDRRLDRGEQTPTEEFERVGVEQRRPELGFQLPVVVQLNERPDDDQCAGEQRKRRADLHPALASGAELFDQDVRCGHFLIAFAPHDDVQRKRFAVRRHRLIENRESSQRNR